MKQEIREIELNGVIYVPKESVKEQAVSIEGKPYCIFRGHECGVHAGYLLEDRVYGSPNAFKVGLARRLWRWDSEFTLTELADSGIRNADNCKFSVESAIAVTLLDVYEIIPCTKTASDSIRKVVAYANKNN